MWIAEDAKVGKNVLDLAPVEEALPSDETIGDLFLAETLFDDTRLRVGTEEDGIVFELGPLHVMAIPNLTSNQFSFFLFAWNANKPNLVVTRVLGPQPLVASSNVVPDEMVGRFQNRLGAPIVLSNLITFGEGKKRSNSRMLVTSAPRHP